MGLKWPFGAVNPTPFPVAITATSTSLTATWSAFGAAVNYSVFMGVSPDQMIPVARNITALNYTNSNLVEGCQYFVQVVANLSLESAAGSEVQQIVLPPPAPTLTLGAITSSSIALSWTASSGATLPYNVYMGTTPGGEDFSTPVATTSSLGATISGLTSGQEYYFVVEAANEGGSSATSNEVSGMTTGSLMAWDPASSSWMLSNNNFTASAGD